MQSPLSAEPPHDGHSYAALASDPDVQAIYVATPHPFHLETAQLCLQQGKAVLCEKPLAANLAQTESLVASARQHGAFLMEAMWTRFNPVMIQVRTWLAEGRAQSASRETTSRVPINGKTIALETFAHERP